MNAFDPVRLLAIARKEWIQLRRDPRSMILAFALPLVLLLFFGYAISWDVEDLEVMVLDQDRSPQSRELAEALTASGYFDLRYDSPTQRDAEAALRLGRVHGVLTIPPRYGSALARGESPHVQLVLDGSDANTATIAQNAAEAVASTVGPGTASRTPAPPFVIQARTWYNPELQSRHMIVPGLIAVIMSIIAAMLTALTIAREWERGTMEQLVATPVSRFEVVLGKLLPYLGIGLLDVAVTVAAGVAVFGTPLNGSLLYLGLLTLLFLLGALGLGIFISAAVRAQVLATQFALVATYLPALLLSGFLFDIASMPGALQAATFLVPARYYITVTRGIFLKGVGLDVLWPQALFMLAYASLGVGLAVRAFKKELPG